MEKFLISSIPRRTSETGLYRVDVSMKYIQRTFEDYERDWNLDMNPDFQRGHVWTMEQRTAYMEYLLSGGRPDHIKLNDPSLNNSQFKPEMVIVDGLQRTTTMIMFMNDEVPVFGGHLYSQIEDVNRYVGRLYIPIMINDLKTRKEVLKWYLEINSGGTPHTDEELNRVKELYNKS